MRPADAPWLLLIELLCFFSVFPLNSLFITSGNPPLWDLATAAGAALGLRTRLWVIVLSGELAMDGTMDALGHVLENRDLSFQVDLMFNLTFLVN